MQSQAPAQAQPPAAPEPEVAPAAPPLPLNEDMARIIEEQVGVIVQKHGYHAQLFFGVSGIGSDSVNTRNSTLAIANALRSGNSQQVTYALTNLGDPQISQINDHTPIHAKKACRAMVPKKYWGPAGMRSAP